MVEKIVRIGEETYRVSNMDTMDQVLIAKKLLPVVGPLASVVAVKPNELREKAAEAMPAMIAPITAAIQGMSDADMRWLFDAALSAVERKQGELWAPVWSRAAGKGMFADMQLAAILQLVGVVLQHNFGPFITDLLSNLGGDPPKPNEA